jgi:3-phosphoshikimate 1-carboxyvinyltransferase
MGGGTMTGQRMFYRGTIPASKSILNRLLILRSFSSELKIEGDSDADDVAKMKSALDHFAKAEPADCGAAGTTLRFLSLRASRKPGSHHLSGSLRLFQRPQDEIRNLLSQLGCEVEMGPQRMTIRGNGWHVPSQGVKIDRSISSQFASGLVLSAWDLPAPLAVHFTGDTVSESYFQMTIKLAEQAGLKLEKIERGFIIPAHSKLRATRMRAEIDTSSAFAVAALAVAHNATAEFEHWPVKSLQPDTIFSEVLQQMGCEADLIGEGDHASMRISRTGELQGIEFDLRESPDLFPVLGILCGMAKGRSRLYGAPHLEHKESNRIEKTGELLTGMGRKWQRIDGGMIIEGDIHLPKGPSGLKFETDHDHRLAFAAAVVNAFGFGIEILHPQVVTKSFPSFWTIAGQGSHPGDRAVLS